MLNPTASPKTAIAMAIIRDRLKTTNRCIGITIKRNFRAGFITPS
jgi:replicative superfamily II helicase